MLDVILDKPGLDNEQLDKPQSEKFFTTWVIGVITCITFK